jgi:hypothetical protein
VGSKVRFPLPHTLDGGDILTKLAALHEQSNRYKRSGAPTFTDPTPASVGKDHPRELAAKKETRIQIAFHPGACDAQSKVRRVSVDYSLSLACCESCLHFRASGFNVPNCLHPYGDEQEADPCESRPFRMQGAIK